MPRWLIQLARLVETATSGEVVTNRAATSLISLKATKIWPKAPCVEARSGTRMPKISGTRKGHGVTGAAGGSGGGNKRRGGNTRVPGTRKGHGVTGAAGGSGWDIIS